MTFLLSVLLWNIVNHFGFRWNQFARYCRIWNNPKSSHSWVNVLAEYNVFYQLSSESHSFCLVMKSICQILSNMESKVSSHSCVNLFADHWKMTHFVLRWNQFAWYWQIWGTQHLISFLRKLVRHNGFYRSSDQQWEFDLLVLVILSYTGLALLLVLFWF